jgi:hypothetical protein
MPERSPNNSQGSFAAAAAAFGAKRLVFPVARGERRFKMGSQESVGDSSLEAMA